MRGPISLEGILNIRSLSMLALASALILSSCTTLSPPGGGAPERKQIADRLVELLSRYAANDQDGVVHLLDENDFVIYGSDLSEVVRSPGELRQLMSDDFALWQTAQFGAIEDLDIKIDGTLATAFFDVPFSAGGRPPVVVRFSTVWRKVAGEWFLTASTNAVPTVGSSARELAHRK